MKWCSIAFNGEHKENTICSQKTCQLNYPCQNSDSCSYFTVTLERGIYRVEVFGAEGGGYPSNTKSLGGKGGSLSGILFLYKARTFYAYVGAKGVTATRDVSKPSFGGGGSGYSYQNDQRISSGGGASDLRLNPNDFKSRVIVAGGGGGGSQHDAAGCGLFHIGGNGTGFYTTKTDFSSSKGIFGFGGNTTKAVAKDGSGGGGGYYGGEAGEGCSRAGKGGTGFVNERLFKKSFAKEGVREGNGLITIEKLPGIYTVPYGQENMFYLILIMILVCTKA